MPAAEGPGIHFGEMLWPVPDLRNNTGSHLFLGFCPVVIHSFDAVCHRMSIKISCKPRCGVSFLFCFSSVSFLGVVSASTGHTVPAAVPMFPCQEQEETPGLALILPIPKVMGGGKDRSRPVVLRTRRASLSWIKLRGFTPDEEEKQTTDGRIASLSLPNLEKPAGMICASSSWILRAQPHNLQASSRQVPNTGASKCHGGLLCKPWWWCC